MEENASMLVREDLTYMGLGVALGLALFWGLPSLSHAAEPAAPIPVSTTGIISLDVATGFKEFTSFRADAAGDMEVCVELSALQACRWVKLRAQVPAGRTYVGFRSVPIPSSRIELYWK